VTDTLLEEAKSTKIGVAYFYCDYGVSRAHNFAATILRQLLTHMDQMPQPILEFYELYKKSGFPRSQSEVFRLLKQVCAIFEECVIIIDALDESDSQYQRREILQMLHGLNSSTTKFFITSRPHESDIQAALQYALKIEVAAH
jgi:hypothetical protein